jgi:hypothetical protein
MHAEGCRYTCRFVPKRAYVTVLATNLHVFTFFQNIVTFEPCVEIMLPFYYWVSRDELKAKPLMAMFR